MNTAHPLFPSPKVEQLSARTLCRINTAGSVDNGKSTFIGRLLFDSGGLPKDVITAIAARAESTNKKGLNLAAFTDGLRAEREQGITIDASYRYFSRGSRDFIIADAPGHFEFTRNMVTATSHSDITLLLIDATTGIVEQNRRHAYVASLVGVEHTVVLINKMDAVGFSKAVFKKVVADFASVLEKITSRAPIFIPISALSGDNVVLRSKQMPWYKGLSVIECLEDVSLGHPSSADDELRFVVQWASRIGRSSGKRFELGGKVASGTLEQGNNVLVRPHNAKGAVESVSDLSGPLGALSYPNIGRIVVRGATRVQRGDILTGRVSSLISTDSFPTELCWIDQKAHRPRAEYILQVGTQSVTATISHIDSKVDVRTFEHKPNHPSSPLSVNEIGRATLSTGTRILIERNNRKSPQGRFILIDPRTKHTVAVGVML